MLKTSGRHNKSSPPDRIVHLNNLLQKKQVGALPLGSRSLRPATVKAGPGGLQSASGEKLPI